MLHITATEGSAQAHEWPGVPGFWFAVARGPVLTDGDTRWYYETGWFAGRERSYGESPSRWFEAPDVPVVAARQALQIVDLEDRNLVPLWVLAKLAADQARELDANVEKVRAEEEREPDQRFLDMALWLHALPARLGFS